MLVGSRVPSSRLCRIILFALFLLGLGLLVSRGPITVLPQRKWLSSFQPLTQTSRDQEQVETPANDTRQHSQISNTQSPHLEKVNATFISLSRNSDVWEIAASIKQIEDRFNGRYHYDWVFLNDKEFDGTFKRVVRSLVSGTARFGKIPREHWSFPSHIDVDKAAKVRQQMKEADIIYGDSISYRHMCRFQSGFFFRHPLMLEYEWYWRVEPGVKFYCDIPFDPFRVMVEKQKKYGFVISLYEYVETIQTIWDTVKGFMQAHPEHIQEGNLMDFLSDDGGYSYNRCHFWSNFEIASLNWLRSPAYMDYFDHLDQAGGFFYERWGDAPVHSIAAALLLKQDEIHFFNEIGYYHAPFHHCPTGNKIKEELRCYCNPKDNFDWKGYSCTSHFFDVMNWEKPAGYDLEQD